MSARCFVIIYSIVELSRRLLDSVRSLRIGVEVYLHKADIVVQDLGKLFTGRQSCNVKAASG